MLIVLLCKLLTISKIPPPIYKNVDVLWTEVPAAAFYSLEITDTYINEKLSKRYDQSVCNSALFFYLYLADPFVGSFRNRYLL